MLPTMGTVCQESFRMSSTTFTYRKAKNTPDPELKQSFYSSEILIFESILKMLPTMGTNSEVTITMNLTKKGVIFYRFSRLLQSYDLF